MYILSQLKGVIDVAALDGPQVIHTTEQGGTGEGKGRFVGPQSLSPVGEEHAGTQVCPGRVTSYVDAVW